MSYDETLTLGQVQRVVLQCRCARAASPPARRRTTRCLGSRLRRGEGMSRVDPYLMPSPRLRTHGYGEGDERPAHLASGQDADAAVARNPSDTHAGDPAEPSPR